MHKHTSACMHSRASGRTHSLTLVYMYAINMNMQLSTLNMN